MKKILYIFLLLISIKCFSDDTNYILEADMHQAVWTNWNLLDTTRLVVNGQEISSLTAGVFQIWVGASNFYGNIYLTGGVSVVNSSTILFNAYSGPFTQSFSIAYSGATTNGIDVTLGASNTLLTSHGTNLGVFFDTYAQLGLATGVPVYVDTGLTNGIIQGQVDNLSISNLSKQFYVTLSGLATGSPVYVDIGLTNGVIQGQTTIATLTNSGKNFYLTLSGISTGTPIYTEADPVFTNANFQGDVTGKWNNITIAGYQESGDFSSRPSASGDSAIAIGFNARASSDKAIAIGNNLAAGANSYCGGGGDSGNANYGDYAAILSGGSCSITNDVTYSVICGGEANNIKALGTSGEDCAIVGGQVNSIVSGANCFIGGGSGSSMSSNSYSSIVGGQNNSMTRFCDWSFIGGGQGNIIASNFCFVGGGSGNFVGGSYSIVLGGNGNSAPIANNVILGGAANTASGSYCVVFGRNNLNNGTDTIIAGGYQNGIGYDSDLGIAYPGNNDSFSAVVGGQLNQVIGGSAWGFIGGGYLNQILNDSDFSVVVGGRRNTMNGDTANTFANAILSGVNNGIQNCSFSTVIGGTGNVINASLSIAGGVKSTTTNVGCFVWSDSRGTIDTTASNQWMIKTQDSVCTGLTSTADFYYNNTLVFATPTNAIADNSILSGDGTANTKWSTAAQLGLATGTPLYVESDPIWTATSSSYTRVGIPVPQSFSVQTIYTNSGTTLTLDGNYELINAAVSQPIIEFYIGQASPTLFVHKASAPSGVAGSNDVPFHLTVPASWTFQWKTNLTVGSATARIGASTVRFN